MKNREELRYYLGKVDHSVEDERLSSLIRFCLQAKGTDEDYSILEARFKDFA